MQHDQEKDRRSTERVAAAATPETSSPALRKRALRHAMLPVIEGVERRTFLSTTAPTPILLIDDVTDSLTDAVNTTIAALSGWDPQNPRDDRAPPD